jgi:hypothetical protein
VPLFDRKFRYAMEMNSVVHAVGEGFMRLGLFELLFADRRGVELDLSLGDRLGNCLCRACWKYVRLSLV